MSQHMFKDLSAYPWTKNFTSNFIGIKSELNAIINLPLRELNENTWAGERPNYLDTSFHKNQAWKTYTFRFFGIDHVPNCKSCPLIYNLIKDIPDLVTVEFSMLEPDTHILPHRGYTDLVLRSHLGLIVPEGDLGLRVGDETRKWAEGEMIMFNDAAEHEAWNKTNERRVVLMMDFVNPDCGMTGKEVAQKIISETTDSHVLNIAPREHWLNWIEEGQFPLEV